MNEDRIHYKETQFGFEYGSAKIERLGKNIRTPGDVIIGITTPKIGEWGIWIRVTKTGKVIITEQYKSEAKHNENKNR